jgi:hypothetical protein
MPSFNLTATGSTDAIPVGGGISVNLSGTFVGTLQFQRATTPGGTFQPIAADSFGSLLQFTGPSGDLLIVPAPNEGDAVVRATCTAFTSGTLVVRIGK